MIKYTGTAYYKKAIELLNKELPDYAPLTKDAEVNTIFDTYCWYKNGTFTFSKICDMLTYNEESLKRWYDGIDNSLELQYLISIY